MYTQEWWHEVAALADGRLRQVEQMIRVIVRAMLTEVDDHPVRHREESERQRQIMAEVEARRYENERRKVEQHLIDDLTAQVDRWELARRIRSYRRAAPRAALEQRTPVEPNEPVASWLCWMYEVVGRLDPFVVRLPEPE